MITVIVICTVAAIAGLLYFFMASGKKMQDGGEWLTGYQYAHRGLHDKECPENTMPAFENAAEQGYGIELDVQLSKDGEIMVFHDDVLARVTNRQGKIKDMDAAELTNIPVGGTQYMIPRLKDVLKMVNGKVPLLIETKNEGLAGELETKLHQMMEGYQGRYAVQSFSPFSMGWFKKNAPHVLRGQLSCDFLHGAEHIASFKRFMARHLLGNFLARPNFISYETNGVHTCVVQRLRKRGIPALVWVVRDKNMQSGLEKYVDTIIFESYCPK